MAPEAQPEADVDGLKNHFEFIHGLEPLDGMVLEEPVTIIPLGGGLSELSFRINSEAAGT